MPDEHYDNPALAELYDVECGWSADRDFYLALASSRPLKILDLGCGTGLLCHAFAAKGHEVTGVDPSQAMLAIARAKPCGGMVEWVQAQAQTYRSEHRFDLIIMTGHAFQVLLENQDVEAAFDTIRRHLKAGGRAVFESRNPAINWAGRWNQDFAIDGQNGSIPVSRRVISDIDHMITFETCYALPGECLTSASVLRFWTHGEIETHAANAGLETEWILGDWDGAPFKAEKSEEMIFAIRQMRQEPKG